jgi:hypothetical protein
MYVVICIDGGIWGLAVVGHNTEQIKMNYWQSHGEMIVLGFVANTPRG